MPTKGNKAAEKKKAVEKRPAVKAAPKNKATARAAAAVSRKAPSSPKVAGRTSHPSAGNVALVCSAEQDGSLVVAVAYEGPLAKREQVRARAGALRQGGSPWGETVEVDLSPEGEGRWVGRLALPVGEPVQAVQIVFRACEDWDNGGRAPLGYYEWNVEQETLEVR